MVFTLKIVRAVKGLDAPWEITNNSNGGEMMLVRHGTIVSVPLVNVLNGLAEERLLIWQLRAALEHWGVEMYPVPKARSDQEETAGTSRSSDLPCERREDHHGEPITRD